MSFSIKKLIKTAHQEHRGRMHYLQTYARLYTALLRELLKAKVNIINVMLGYKSVQISITGDYEMLLRTMRVLRSYGLNAEKRPAEGEATYCAYWTASLDDIDGIDDRDVRVILDFSSTQCQRVQVGTKLQEVPVYEVRCKD
jgi:hypothetical protein